MAKKNTLRALSKKWPAPPELEKTLRAAQADSSDRSAAIIGAAVLEGVLERFIVKKLSHSDKPMLDALFKNRGPLSDFHSKIVIARAFGLITSPMADEMHRVKSIRNVFAHAVADVNFKTPEILKEALEFRMIQAMEKRNEGVGRRTFDNAKSNYLLVVEILAIMLSYHHAAAHSEELFGEPPVKSGAPSGSN